MNKLLITAFVCLFSFQSFAAQVLSARMDSSGKNILIDVAYTGGCGTHDFSLKVAELCLESDPVQCSAELIHKTDDSCEASIQETIKISLKKAGLTDSYFKNASLVIFGDYDIMTNELTQVRLTLP